MKAEFITIENYYTSELIEKKSRFIAHIAPVKDKVEAEEFFRDIRTRFKDARHNVPAFRLGVEVIEEWANDDGEPAGTAGRPILDVIRAADLTNVAVMVTRYFGGVLLGTGGLVRAYGGVTSQMISEITLVKKLLHRRIYIETDYKNLGSVKRYMDDNALFNNMDCAQNVVLTYDVLLENLIVAKKEITDLCSGQIAIEEGENVYISV